jgi:hypothetical protein
MVDSTVRRSGSAVAILLLLISMHAAGCVRRRMTLRSSPAGATVYIDDQQIGTTPVSTSYVYYGTRKIQLVKDGYETLTVKQKFKPPWYQIAGVDFVTENLIPYEFRDERVVEFEMQPQPVVPATELLERAQQLRRATADGYTVAPPPTAPPSRDSNATDDPPNYPADGRPLPPPFEP